MFQTAPGYAGIILPIPENLVDLDSTNWQEEDAGFLTGSAINAGAAGLQSAVGGGSFGQVVSAIANTAATPGNVATGLALKTLPAIQSVVGLAPNEFVTMLFRGPKYKRHRFSWNWHLTILLKLTKFE